MVSAPTASASARSNGPSPSTATSPGVSSFSTWFSEPRSPAAEEYAGDTGA